MPEYKRIIQVFTDGACRNNGKPNALAGIGVYFPYKELPDISAPVDGAQTNQRAELQAVLAAFRCTTTYPHKLEIFTDSMYAIKLVTIWMEKWITKGNKMANWDLVMQLYNASLGREFQMIHVKGHQKLVDLDLTLYDDFLAYGNHMADKLATSAIKDINQE